MSTEDAETFGVFSTFGLLCNLLGLCLGNHYSKYQRASAESEVEEDRMPGEASVST